MKHFYLIGFIVGAMIASFTPFSVSAIVAALLIGAVAGLILVYRNAFENESKAVKKFNQDLRDSDADFEAYQEREQERLRDERDLARRFLEEQAAIELERIRDRQDRERNEVTQKLDTDALEASLQDEDEENSQIEGLLEYALPLIPLTDEEIDAILARPLSETDEEEIAQAAERARKRFRDKLNRDNWRMGLNSGSREIIDNGIE